MVNITSQLTDLANPRARTEVARAQSPGAIAGSVAQLDARLEANRHPRVDGKFLRVNGDRFLVRGVTYGSFAANEDGEPFPSLHQLRDDFSRMREAGINTVRLYSSPSDRVADAAADAGLYLVPDICWGPRTCEWDYPAWWQKAIDGTRAEARRLAGHPAILMFSIGNEIPPLMVRWYGRTRTEERLRILYETVKAEAPDAIVTYVNHPPTEHLTLPFLDVVSYNVYLNSEQAFRGYLARLQCLAGDRPLFLSEVGLDSQESGEEEQARYLDWQLRAIFEKGLCGAAVYSWTDEWSIFASDITGWSFGLTTADRAPKLALSTVRDIYSSSLYKLRKAPWPQVSVVVAAYNGGAWLNDCLSWLTRLNYANYEVIVVNDGSTDQTAEIIRRHGVRGIHVPNGGLSRARNLGIEAAKGQIVAFTDSDAHPDPDWLCYLVCALEEQQAAAVGGPNIAPKDDGFVADCVDCSPGNPTHVLLDDERAEHIPGCNMAFLKRALLEIGMFDATHRSAGDDVDICWKLLVRGHTIAFSPSAIVHHHRRGTVGAYLRQQRGYGFAESHLQRRYPGRYNYFGHQVWRGNIYDTVHHGLRQFGFPLLFTSKVYQGSFGSAQFQAIYHPFMTWWFQIFTALEWQGITAAFLLAGLVGACSAADGAWVPLTMGAVLVAFTLGSALLCAVHASHRKPWKGYGRVRGVLLIALLHVLQPLARGLGRWKGWRAERRLPHRFPPSQRLYGNLLQRSALLDGLQDHLRSCGWISHPADEWSESDIEIPGPGPYRLAITTVYEDDVAHACHYMRYRITATMKPFTPLVIIVLTLVLVAVGLHPWLFPLAVPVALLLRKFLTARATMINAVSQLTSEYGEALGMVKAGDDF
jgi:GT2 family glycosyltransferase